MRTLSPFGDVAAFAPGSQPVRGGRSDMRHEPLRSVSAPN